MSGKTREQRKIYQIILFYIISLHENYSCYISRLVYSAFGDDWYPQGDFGVGQTLPNIRRRGTGRSVTKILVQPKNSRIIESPLLNRS